MNDNKLAVFSERLITPLVEIADGVVLIDDGKIVAVGSQANIDIPEHYRRIELGDKVVAPGFFDIHNHGGMGYMVDEGGRKTVLDNSARLVRSGCTSWLPTVDSLYGVKEIIAAMDTDQLGAEVAGIHMEGPFLTPKEVGKVEGIDQGLEKPTLERFYEFYNAAEGHLKIMGISVELDGADVIIKELRKLNVLPAVCHSTKATYEDFVRGVELGIRHVTHTFNVMTPLHQRKPGVVGGALTCNQVTNEIIADGFHVSPVAIDILLRCKGVDQVCLITDNTMVAGLPDGEYERDGYKLIKENGVTRYANSTSEDDHTMAGSEWEIDQGIRVLVNQVHVKLADAIRMASLTPARVVGLDHRIGSLEPGKDADIVVLDEDLRVFLTIAKGKVAYDPSGLFSN
jgi:N-acetylglucosamine-6-phosphate deacetylase